MLLAFIPMYFIAVAYQELNKAEPDCGTTFTWATRAFGSARRLDGRLGHHRRRHHRHGQPRADRRSVRLHASSSADGLAASTFWSTVAGVIWIIIMTYICYRGIEISARIQYVLLGAEVIVLVIFSALRARQGLRRRRAQGLACTRACRG